MKQQLTRLLLFFSLCTSAQEVSFSKLSEFVVTPEILLGISAEANDFFPDRDLQKQLILGFGRKHDHNPQEWAYWLKAPKTGLTLGYTDLGNSEALGSILSVMPFLEFDVFNRRKKDMKVLIGLGGSYFNKKYDPEDNPFNQAVTTRVTWSFRASYFYEFLKTQKVDYRLGLVYYHHSNGHTQLPNQGYNSFLVSLSADIKNPYNLGIPEATSEEKTIPEKTVYDYLSVRLGSGRNTLALAFNDKKPVYSFAGEYGKVWNKTYKIGIGFYYRYYQHYYDYIKGNESLVQEGEEFENYKSDPFWNASAVGLYLNSEFLLNHFGIEINLGANLFKPAYKIDWRINEGWDNAPRDIPGNWVYGEFTTKYQLKQIVYSRLGLKYYLLGTDQVPTHNIYVGAHINANLGQADFSEVSLGYTYSFQPKKKGS